MLLLKSRQCLFKYVGFGSVFIWSFRWCFLYFISFFIPIAFYAFASVLVMILFFSKFNFIEFFFFPPPN